MFQYIGLAVLASEKSACLCAQQIRFHHHHQRLLLLVCPNFLLSFPNLLAVAPFSKRKKKKKREMRTWVFAGFASLSIVAELWPGYCDVRVTHGVKRHVNERPASAHGSCRRPYTHSHPEECDSAVCIFIEKEKMSSPEQKRISLTAVYQVAQFKLWCGRVTNIFLMMR